MANKHRVQLDFSEEALEGLDTLKDELHSASRTEVLRRALALLHYAAKAEKEGGSLVIELKDGTKETVRLF